MFELDRDHDGAFIDDAFGWLGNVAMMATGAGAGIGLAPLAGAVGASASAAGGAAAGAGGSIAGYLGGGLIAPFYHDVGDALSDFLGTRGDPDKNTEDSDYKPGADDTVAEELHDKTDGTGATIGKFIGSAAGAAMGVIPPLLPLLPATMSAGAGVGAAIGSAFDWAFGD